MRSKFIGIFSITTIVFLFFLGVSRAGEEDNAITLPTKEFAILKIKIVRVWSDQYEGIGAVTNFLPGGAGLKSFDLEGDYILMGAREDGKAYVGAQIQVTPNVLSVQDKVLVRLAGIAPDMVVGDGQLVGNFASMWTDLIVAQDYTVVAGIDVDGDNQLNQEEITAKSPFRFKIINQGRYALGYSHLLVLATGGWLPYPIASSFLSAFLFNSVPDGATSVSTNISFATPICKPEINCLSHNVGVIFDVSGSGPIQKHVFSGTSDLAYGIIEDPAFDEMLVKTFDRNKSEVQEFLKHNPGGVFTWKLLNKDTPIVIEFKDGNIYYALGKAYLNDVSVKVTVNMFARVTYLHITGRLTDLYDWEYEIDPSSAIVQAGYDTLGQGGHVFRVQVDFDTEIWTYDYIFD